MVYRPLGRSAVSKTGAEKARQVPAALSYESSRPYVTVRLTLDVGPVEVALLAGFVVAVTAFVMACGRHRRGGDRELLELIKTIKGL
jgi:hypothetical protein